jgi:hypothetical protein
VAKPQKPAGGAGGQGAITASNITPAWANVGGSTAGYGGGGGLTFGGFGTAGTASSAPNIVWQSTSSGSSYTPAATALKR